MMEPLILPGKIAALIPAYCEERQIAEIVRRTRPYVERVLVVDDGSGDQTGDQAREAGAEVIRHPHNRGKGAAIKTSLRQLLAEGFSYVILLDADGQHLPEEIPLFFARRG